MSLEILGLISICVCRSGSTKVGLKLDSDEVTLTQLYRRFGELVFRALYVLWSIAKKKGCHISDRVLLTSKSK